MNIMRIGAFNFSPRPLPTLATAILLPLLISLGFWQLDRAAEKHQLQVLMQQRLLAPIKRIRSAENLQEDMNFRQVEMRGRFDDAHQYLVDNRVYKGQVGYGVYTPFSFDAGESWILVNRGWTAIGKDRITLPSITISSEMMELKGVLSQPPGQLMQLGGQLADTATWPARVQNINLARIEKESGLQLQPYILNLDESHAQAYFQDWRPYVDTPQKNQSYAIQWFSMAVVLLLIYISLNTRRLLQPIPKPDEE